MKSVKSRSKKNGQALLSLVKSNLEKNVTASEVKQSAASRREKKTTKIRSDYDQIQDSQSLQLQPQKQSDINSSIFDQGGHVDDSLWLCIYFPKLSVDITVADKYRVIYQEDKGRCIIYRTNVAVADTGVTPGMTLDAARILCPALKALLRDERAEDKHIQKLADWAYRYSSDLSVINNDTLVLEVGSSTRLFKGLKTLCDLMAGQLAIEWDMDYRMAVSPTQLASMTLAQQIIDKDNIPIVMKKQALRSVLGKLPVEALLNNKTVLSSKKTKSTAFTIKDIKSLNSMGVYTLSDLWRLPYEGLLTRFGIKALDYLDRLLGKQADPAKLYEPAMRFNAELELPLEVKSNKLVLQALSKLLDELITYLITQDAGTDEIKILLTHSQSHHSPTSLIIQLSQYVRDKKHIFSLIEERFNRVLLTAPVIGVYLSADSIEVYSTSPRDLFEYDTTCASSDKNSNAWKILLEQFNARLGQNKITNITSVDDHRPERAWRYQQEGKKQTHYDDEYLLRPMWLLPEAVRLVSHQTQLELLQGPERIENGWWDGDDIRRDYYIARDKAGARLWVYCDLKQKAHWYVHGLFA